MPAPLITTAAHAGNVNALLKRAQSEQRQKKLAWAIAFQIRREAMINTHAQYTSYREAADIGDSADGIKAKLRKLEADLRKKTRVSNLLHDNGPTDWQSAAQRIRRIL